MRRPRRKPRRNRICASPRPATESSNDNMTNAVENFMKTVTLRSAVMLLSVCAFVAAGCTATQTQRSAGETIDDTTITAKVKAGLIDNDTTSAGQIEVETYRGVVQLNGFVDSNEEKAAA